MEHSTFVFLILAILVLVYCNILLNAATDVEIMSSITSITAVRTCLIQIFWCIVQFMRSYIIIPVRTYENTLAIFHWLLTGFCWVTYLWAIPDLVLFYLLEDSVTYEPTLLLKSKLLVCDSGFLLRLVGSYRTGNSLWFVV
jgi:hypothetical protein